MAKKKSIPESTRRAVAERYGCVPGSQLQEVPCYWCGAKGSITWHRLADGRPSSWVSFSHELDHVVPEASGGSGAPENIVLACRRCNRSRGHRSHLPHHLLTEELMSDSRHPHDTLTPGREGKGREQGSGREGRWLTSSFNVTSVTRELGVGR